MNEIKIARATTKDKLPAQKYGLVTFVDKDRVIVGNKDKTDFVVNDYNNLINVPAGNDGGGAVDLTIPAGGEILIGNAVYFDESGALLSLQVPDETVVDPVYTEIINNGEFSSSTDGWLLTTDNADADMAIESSRLRIICKNVGTDAYESVVLSYDEFAHTKGRTYTLSLDVRADITRPIVAQYRKKGDPTTVYEEKTFYASNQEWTTFTWQTTIDVNSAEDTELVFLLGYYGVNTWYHKIYFDNISLVETTAGFGFVDIPDNIIGIAVNGANVGDDVTVRSAGVINSSHTFVPGKVVYYIPQTGSMTNDGEIQNAVAIGVAISTTSLLLRLSLSY